MIRRSLLTKLSHCSWRGNISTKKILLCQVRNLRQNAYFIPIYFTKDAIKFVAQKLSGDSEPGSTDSEALQGWLSKFGEDCTRLRTSVENSVDWLANGSPPWAVCRALMSGHLIALNKQTDVRLVGVGETWRCLFSNIVLKATEPEATMVFQVDQICAGLKAQIDGAVHRVKDIWDEKSTT